jgi:gas vesicle protein
MNRELIRTGYSGTNLLLAFAAGAVLGTITALLLAPDRGAETRRKLRDTAREAARKPSEFAHRVADAVHEGRATAEAEVVDALAEKH